MKKRVLSLFLALILCLGLLPLPAAAAGETVASGYCGADEDGKNLSWTLTADGTLTISGTGKMEDYDHYAPYPSTSPWEDHKQIISTVVIQEGVTTIGDNTFGDCEALTSVTLPEGLTTIGDSAFGNCDMLMSVTIPAGVTTIRGNAFGDCDALTSVTLPESLTTIGDLAFSYCDALTSFTVAEGNPVYTAVDGVLFNKDKTTLIQYPAGSATTYEIPDGVTTIDKMAFSECFSLTNVAFPASLTTIGYSAFEYCFDLSDVTFPESLTTIGDWAFEECDSLHDVTIPASVTTIGRGAFSRCDALTSFTVAEDNPVYTAMDGVLFNKEKDTLLQYYFLANPRTTYKVPDGVTTINDYAFVDSHLTSVTLPEGLTTIGIYAFSFSYALADINFPEGLTTIGEFAFSDCALTSVTFPKSLTTIGWGAFTDCEALTSVTIPASVTTIDEVAFSGCKALTSLTVAADNPAYTAEDGVLFNKDKTTLIQYLSANPRTTYKIPDGVTTICNSAFSECDTLVSVTIPASATVIDPYAFDQTPLISVRFLGDAPIDSAPFSDHSLTAYYPKDNSTWTEEAKERLASGAIDVTWVGIGPEDEICTVIVAPAQHGKVTVTPRTGLAGTTATLTITPDDGYALDTLAVKQADGTAVEVTDKTFTMPASDVTVTAAFKPASPETYTVTVWSAQHGKVTASPAKAEAGTKVTLTVAPDSGYELGTLTVKRLDGTAVTVTNNTFTMPASDVTVTPTFKATTYTVIVWSAQHGKVTASPKEGTAGTKITLTVTPDKGYELDALTVKQSNGTTVKVTDNTFTMPASDVTVTPTFKELPPETYTVTVTNAQHGKVTASPVKGTAGTKVTLTVTPDSGYELDTLVVKQSNGTAVKVTNNTFTMPASDVTVSATFKALPVDRLSLSRSSVSVSVGSSASVTATVSGYTGKHVYAISSDTSVVAASVSGKTVRVKGVAQGTATIYVAMTDAAAMTLDQVKADPSVKEIKVTVTKTGTNTGGGGGGSTGGGGGGGTGGGGGGASGGSSSGGSTGGSTGSTPNIPATQTFTDVAKGGWYESGVTFVVSKGLFNGVGANQFAPQQNMTRAMLMTVLARLDGQSTDGGATWYAKGMAWAVAQGVSDGTNPEGNITREQLVTMLYRYAKSPAVDAADMAKFVDANAVSDWAADAMRWAVRNGILTGKDGARLDPQGTATRAEVATILQRYVNL